MFGLSRATQRRNEEKLEEVKRSFRYGINGFKRRPQCVWYSPRRDFITKFGHIADNFVELLPKYSGTSYEKRPCRCWKASVYTIYRCEKNSHTYERADGRRDRNEWIITTRDDSCHARVRFTRPSSYIGMLFAFGVPSAASACITNSMVPRPILRRVLYLLPRD